MIFLDANAFYSYFGRAKLNMTSSPVDEVKLRKFLDARDDVNLPTSVFIEIVVHFRNDTKKLQELISFMKSKRFALYNNIPDYVINPNEYTCVTLMDKVNLSTYAQKLLEKKIEIECNFT